MYNQEPVQLDPALQALLTLKQRANLTLPNEQPTIAGQTIRQMMGQMGGPQNQGMPPQGMQQQQGQMQPSPQQQQGLPGIIANVQRANPSTQQNAQQGQVDQMAQQVSQRMQQQQQPPGLSGLPAGNMGFKEGGIVPYAAGGEIDLSGLYGRGFSPNDMTASLPENPEVAAIRARQAEIEALNRARPDFYAQQVAALDADRQARAAAAAEQQKRQGFEGLMAILQGGAQSGMAGVGAANTQYNKGITERKEASRQADLLDAQMRVKLGELDYARKIGDVTNAMGVEKDIAGIKRQLEQIGVQREGHGVQREGFGVQTRGQDIQERVAKADRESRERTSAADNVARLAAANLGKDQRANSVNLAQYKEDVKTSGIVDKSKRAVAMAAASPAKAKELRDEINKELAYLAKRNNITYAEAEGELAALMGGAGGAAAPMPSLKYNPKTGKVE